MSAQNYGHKTIAATIVTGASVSTAIYVGGYNHVSFEIPTFAVGANTDTAAVHCLVAKSAIDTFRTLRDMGVYSGASGLYNWEVPNSNGGFTVVCRPAAYFDYVKIELIGTNVTGTAGLACKVHVHN